MNDDLHELPPSDGLELYLGQREAEVRGSTIKTLLSLVGLFVNWCDENDIDPLVNSMGWIYPNFGFK